jgi:hypothetical protein
MTGGDSHAQAAAARDVSPLTLGRDVCDGATAFDNVTFVVDVGQQVPAQHAKVAVVLARPHLKVLVSRHSPSCHDDDHPLQAAATKSHWVDVQQRYNTAHSCLQPRITKWRCSSGERVLLQARMYWCPAPETSCGYAERDRWVLRRAAALCLLRLHWLAIRNRGTGRDFLSSA